MAKYSIGLIFFFLSLTAMAQPTPPGNPPPGPGAPVPITGLEYLIIAGGFLGVNKIRKTLKARNH
jgi:hypothetical protein